MENLRSFQNVIIAIFLIASIIRVPLCNAEPSPSDQAEIKFLIEGIRGTDLVFERNGQRHSAEKAAKHISAKYKQAKSQLTSTEDFIDRVASKSLRTKQPYHVILPEGRTLTSSEYLTSKLRSLRSAQKGAKRKDPNQPNTSADSAAP